MTLIHTCRDLTRCFDVMVESGSVRLVAVAVDYLYFSPDLVEWSLSKSKSYDFVSRWFSKGTNAIMSRILLSNSMALQRLP